VGVVEKAVEQGRDRRGIPEELAPVVDRAVRGEDREARSYRRMTSSRRSSAAV
jgi:hypothetical protein